MAAGIGGLVCIIRFLQLRPQNAGKSREYYGKRPGEVLK